MEHALQYICFELRSYTYSSKYYAVQLFDVDNSTIFV